MSRARYYNRRMEDPSKQATVLWWTNGQMPQVADFTQTSDPVGPELWTYAHEALEEALGRILLGPRPPEKSLWMLFRNEIWDETKIRLQWQKLVRPDA